MLTTTRPIRYTRHNRLDEFLYFHTIHVSDIKRADCTPEVTSRDPCGDNVTTGVQSALHDFSVPQFGPYVNSESWQIRNNRRGLRPGFHIEADPKSKRQCSSLHLRDATRVYPYCRKIRGRVSTLNETALGVLKVGDAPAFTSWPDRETVRSSLTDASPREKDKSPPLEIR